MARPQHRFWLFAALGLSTLAPGASLAEDAGELAPYKMLRSLQFVQDSVVLGDHSAAEMQRFMLTTIDNRFRTVEAAAFDDPRNVDAALIYGMSGGNPETLEYLVSRDVDGHFDNRVTDVLRKYLGGKGLLVGKTLVAMAKEYREQKIGPYLALIGGNVMIATDPKEALQLYDWARLSAPGTIVEEAALRRSIAITTDAGMAKEGLSYSGRYVRRFLHSPYASQFADLFVRLAVEHYGEVKDDDITTILSFMDDARQREVYLRLARSAAIAGKGELARHAAEQARALTSGGDDAFGTLAGFYGGVASVPTSNVGAAMKDISDVSESELSPRDRALRAAAKAVAEAVLRAPDPKSLTQGSTSIPANEEKASETQIPDIAAAPAVNDAGGGETAPRAEHGSTQEGQEADNSFSSFVTTSRSKLDEIDGLLEQESN
ncbi:chemotaxis protein MotC [Rhizobium sp. BK251]|uniref:chemotaxis protein MotC n=1 Tax=Rhizobium sp. BK251 TaxID=2512125 RepID=UPI00104FC625|nr:chemotaxis protein MotC [Rhizobium sp. BK251]TCL75636.1 chemotaxis protein MotC [Rhizobium sp. BK251]